MKKTPFFPSAFALILLMGGLSLPALSLAQTASNTGYYDVYGNYQPYDTTDTGQDPADVYDNGDYMDATYDQTYVDPYDGSATYTDPYADPYYDPNYVDPADQVDPPAPAPVVQPTPTPATVAQDKGVENWVSEYWVQFLALIVSLIGVFFAVTGFTFANQKKKKSVSNFLNQIDDTFDAFKWKSKRCEAELYRLEDMIEDQLKNGKLDESSYDLLTKRINKYLREIQEVEDPIHRRRTSHHINKIAELAEEIEEND